MSKSAQAFRTIREVADWLDVAAHVLRFWESKFNQIKPVKRAGGRRYYRPADVELVGGIKVLLHDRGLTIRGVQKMIADEGLEAVTSLSPPIDELISDSDEIELEPEEVWAEDAAAEAQDEDVTAAAPAPAEAEADPRGPDTHAPEANSPASDDIPMQQPTAPDMVPDFSAPPPQDTPPAIDPRDADLAASPQAAPIATPIMADPAEGPLGTLAAMADLSAHQRAKLHPHIAALAQLRDRMAAPLDAG